MAFYSIQDSETSRISENPSRTKQPCIVFPASPSQPSPKLCQKLLIHLIPSRSFPLSLHSYSTSDIPLTQLNSLFIIRQFDNKSFFNSFPNKAQKVESSAKHVVGVLAVSFRGFPESFLIEFL
jgi:hypothetical protein